MSTKPVPSDARPDAVHPAAPGPLLGRDDECRHLADLVASVEAGEGRSVVLYGGPGMGKTTLLRHAAGLAPDLEAMWIGRVEAEQDLGFAGLHRLLHPLLDRRLDLPPPQRDALGAAFGLDGGTTLDPFMVGLACLTLLTDVASERGLLVVVDDAHWIDDESLAALAFVGGASPPTAGARWRSSSWRRS